jgi:Cu+-exporting ATPase
MDKNIKNIKLMVTGMHCAMCQQTLQNALQVLEGVVSARVNLANENVEVRYNPNQLRFDTLRSAVAQAGYGIATDETVVHIGKMHCAMCAQTIETALLRLEGVFAANVNLASETVSIQYNKELVGPSQFQKVIEDSGYQYLGLETSSATGVREEALQTELRDMRHRFTVGFVTGAVLLLLMWLKIQLPFPKNWLLFAVSTPPFLYLSYPIFRAGWRALRNRSLNMDVMYSMGIGVAFIASILGTFQIFLSPDFIFYETAIFLATFLVLGRYLEARAKSRTSSAIQQLLSLQPLTTFIIHDECEEEIPVAVVQPGDILLVKPGQRLAVDGTVITGESFVDESMITGESLPVFKTEGLAVIAGTVNQNGALRYRAEKVGQKTLLAQIVRIVEQAQSSRPAVQRLADKAVSYFIPLVLLIAVLSFLFWYVIAGQELLFALTTLIAVLVIACPCALGLATPTAVTVGIGRGAELGILIKNSEVLEISPKLTVVVFDKTGTLTVGKPKVTDIYSKDVDAAEVLQLSASAERNSQHPLGNAIVNHAEAAKLKLFTSEKFNGFGGQGISAEIDGQQILVGSEALMQAQAVEISPEYQSWVQDLETKGRTAVLVSKNQHLLGIIAIADTLKSAAATAVQELQQSGLKVKMLTGDNQRIALAIGAELGITDVVAEVLPTEKAAAIQHLQQKGERVAFVGDGINDAPALAQADFGIAMGSGTDIAIESGDIVLMHSDPRDVLAAIQLSRKVMSKIKQNLFWAFAYNTALIPVAAGLLYPLFGIVFKPELGGLAMALSSVTVISLSLLLKRYLPPVYQSSNKTNV